MRLRPEALADGLLDWSEGEDGEAARQIVAEFIIRGLLYLKALAEQS